MKAKYLSVETLCGCAYTLLLETLCVCVCVQAFLRDVGGLAPDHHNNANTAREASYKDGGVSQEG